MLQVWLFFKYGRLAPSPQFAGEHRRALYHNGVVDLRRLVQDQVGPRSEKDRGNVLVTGKSAEPLGESLKLTINTVSANEQIRDELRDLIQPYLDQGVRLLELDYQPAERRRGLWPFTWSRNMIQ